MEQDYPHHRNRLEYKLSNARGIFLGRYLAFFIV